MPLGVRAVDDNLPQFRQLLAAQDSWPITARSRPKTANAVRIVAMHPVAQGLAGHSVERSGFLVRSPFQNQRQRQKTSHNRAISRLPGQGPQARRRMLPPTDLNRLAHR